MFVFQKQSYWSLQSANEQKYQNLVVFEEQSVAITACVNL